MDHQSALAATAPRTARFAAPGDRSLRSLLRRWRLVLVGGLLLVRRLFGWLW